jgi:phenylacetate-CoA ligase
MKPYNLIDLYSLKKNQWKSPQAIKKIQEKKLKKLITHAYQKVPYYRRLFNANQIKPEDINSLEDLKKIPLTTKPQLQKLPLKEKMAQGLSLEECKTMATSGTTGVPLRSFFAIQDSTLMSLSWARSFLNSGMKPWYKMFAFIGQQKVKAKRSWYERFGLWRRMEVSTWDKPEDWISEIQKSKPQVLVGYEMTLKILADAIQKSNIHYIKPKLIFHSSGILDNFSRNFLESVFHAKIIDIYGSNEAGCIAWECKKCSGYHICSDMVIVEVLKNEKSVVPGEEGEVVITNLHSFAMPFIRYRQEDVVTLSSKTPQCGRVFPLLENIVGRLDDFIITNTGEKISPTPFYHSIDPVRGVKRWKIVQESVNKITVKIEPGIGFDNQTIQTISKNLHRLVKDKFRIDISVVDLILINPSAKFRAVSSKLKRYSR